MPYDLVAGPDGNLWFTDRDITDPAIGAMTPGGTFTEYTDGFSGVVPRYLIVGPDANLWFTDTSSASTMGWATTSGAITLLDTNVTPSLRGSAAQPRSAFGGAGFAGSMGGHPLNAPVVAVGSVPVATVRSAHLPSLGLVS